MEKLLHIRLEFLRYKTLPSIENCHRFLLYNKHYLQQYFCFYCSNWQYSFSSIFWIGLMSSLVLKPQIPAFTVHQDSEAMNVLHEKAHELMVSIVLGSGLLVSCLSSCFHCWWTFEFTFFTESRISGPSQSRWSSW